MIGAAACPPKPPCSTIVTIDVLRVVGVGTHHRGEPRRVLEPGSFRGPRLAGHGDLRGREPGEGARRGAAGPDHPTERPADIAELLGRVRDRAVAATVDPFRRGTVRRQDLIDEVRTAQVTAVRDRGVGLRELQGRDLDVARADHRQDVATGHPSIREQARSIGGACGLGPRRVGHEARGLCRQIDTRRRLEAPIMEVPFQEIAVRPERVLHVLIVEVGAERIEHGVARDDQRMADGHPTEVRVCPVVEHGSRLVARFRVLPVTGVVPRHRREALLDRRQPGDRLEGRPRLIGQLGRAVDRRRVRVLRQVLLLLRRQAVYVPAGVEAGVRNHRDDAAGVRIEHDDGARVRLIGTAVLVVVGARVDHPLGERFLGEPLDPGIQRQGEIVARRRRDRAERLDRLAVGVDDQLLLAPLAPQIRLVDGLQAGCADDVVGAVALLLESRVVFRVDQTGVAEHLGGKPPERVRTHRRRHDLNAGKLLVVLRDVEADLFRNELGNGNRLGGQESFVLKLRHDVADRDVGKICDAADDGLALVPQLIRRDAHLEALLVDHELAALCVIDLATQWVRVGESHGIARRLLVEALRRKNLEEPKPGRQRDEHQRHE